MKAREPDTVERKPIKVRRTDFAAERAKIGIAEIVGDDDEKIRPPSLRLALGGSKGA